MSWILQATTHSTNCHDWTACDRGVIKKTPPAIKVHPAHSTSYHDWAVWDGGLFKKDSRRLSYILHMPQATTTLQKAISTGFPDRACVDKSCDKHMAADNKQKVGDTLICRRSWWWESLESWNYVWHVQCRRIFHKEPRSTKYCVGRASQGYSSSNLSPPISLGDLRPAR